MSSKIGKYEIMITLQFIVDDFCVVMKNGPVWAMRKHSMVRPVILDVSCY